MKARRWRCWLGRHDVFWIIVDMTAGTPPPRLEHGYVVGACVVCGKRVAR